MYDIIIIGAGPAGLTAGIYAARANKKVLILEAKSYGGQIIKANEIDNYPAKPHITGMQFAKELYDQTKELGTEIIFEKAVDIKEDKIKKVITNKNTYECKSIIIATGSDNGKLGLENEKELTGRGVSYCATCDGAFYKDEDVAIIGNSDNTLDDAKYLSNIANNVYLINPKDHFEDLNGLLKDLNDNVEILFNTNIVEILGSKKLEKIGINNKNDGIKSLDVSGLFIDVGRVPENENFKKLVKVDKFGYIIAKEDCHTNIKGIFVAGDNRTKVVRQLTTATSDGTVAAIEAIKYINSLKEE